MVNGAEKIEDVFVIGFGALGLGMSFEGAIGAFRTVVRAAGSGLSRGKDRRLKAKAKGEEQGKTDCPGEGFRRGDLVLREAFRSSVSNGTRHNTRASRQIDTSSISWRRREKPGDRKTVAVGNPKGKW